VRDDCGPDTLEVLRFIDAAGAPRGRIELGELIERAGALGELATVIDLDGDGVDEVAIGSPERTVCRAAGCFARAGAVEIISAVSGESLLVLEGADTDARFGTALASHDGWLAVGAPGARRAVAEPRTGALYVYDLRRHGSLATYVTGQTEGERFGQAVVVAGDVDGNGVLELLVGAPFYRFERGRLDVVSVDGTLGARFIGTDPFGRLGSESASILPRKQAPGGVVIGAPRARGGRGRLFIFNWDGTLRFSVAGAPFERLGAAISTAADFDRDGVDEVAVGAPGAFGADGRVRFFSLFGEEQPDLRVSGSRRLGRMLRTADVDADDRPDLLVGGLTIGGVSAPGGVTLTALGLGGKGE
jgi:hypothetical protein